MIYFCISFYAAEVNLALKKKAFQTTKDFGGSANLATDGFLSRNFSNITYVPQCAQTQGNRALPWWRVDMEKIVNVTNVTIFNQIENTGKNHGRLMSCIVSVLILHVVVFRVPFCSLLL